MATPVTPPEARIPLPASRRASPTSTPQSRLGVVNLDDRRFPIRSPLRSASLPVSADANLEAAKAQARDARISSHLRTETSASTPASVSIRGEHQLRRPLIVRSTTSTSTLFRDGSSSVPPPMSRGRYDPDGANRVEPDEGEDDEVDDFYKERGTYDVSGLHPRSGAAESLEKFCDSPYDQRARGIAFDQPFVAGPVSSVVSRIGLSRGFGN
jgi:hypothetical protein